MCTTSAQQVALAASATKIAERREKFPAVIVPNMPELTLSDDLLYLGAFTQSNMTTKQKLIDKGVAIYAGGVVAPPTEWARAYLSVTFGRRPVRLRSQIDACLYPARIPPRFALPGAYRDMVYVDLDAAYWSLLQLFGWDTDYNPARWWGLGNTLTDWFMPSQKLARNMLVSAVTVSSVCTWQAGRVDWRRFNNPFANAPLWAAVQDTLHTIAHFAVRMGAVYVHTDGYIMPRRLADSFAERLYDVGLSVGDKYAGDVHIYGVGRYQFHDSRLLDDREKRPTTTYALNDVPDAWIWARLKRFADIARAEARI